MRPEEIDSFQNYLEKRKVVDSEPDRAEARSLFKRSKQKFENMEKLGIEESTATDYFENVYETCKMLIQAFMALEGYNPYSHEAVIAYALDRLDIDEAIANRLNKYRKLRNDISYRGEAATIEEANRIKKLYKELREELEPEFKKELEG